MEEYDRGGIVDIDLLFFSGEEEKKFFAENPLVFEGNLYTLTNGVYSMRKLVETPDGLVNILAN